jgi:dethiobiotin synthetase
VRGLFVIGTDTGVGKTQVACAVLRLWREAGLRPAALKPAETGCDPHPLDALALQAEAGGQDPLAVVCPFQLRLPLAPAVAARLEGRELSLAQVYACAEELSRGDRPLVVESAGGLLVPFTERETNADLAELLELPVLVVARAGLGTINHVALTLEALASRALPVVLVVLNRAMPGPPELSEATNAAEIARLTGSRVVGPLPFVAEAGERIAQLSRRLANEPALQGRIA